MKIYIGVGKESQKASNIRANNKVSLTINEAYRDWNEIKGLSLGGTARILDSVQEIQHAADCMVKRYPQLLEWTNASQSDIAFLEIWPEVVSVLDYRKGFGHTDLVHV
jgi:general stress protein 26